MNNIRHNIFARPFVARLRMGDTVLEQVFWAESEKDLRERLALELSEKIELLDVKARE